MEPENFLVGSYGVLLQDNYYEAEMTTAMLLPAVGLLGEKGQSLRVEEALALSNSGIGRRHTSLPIWVPRSRGSISVVADTST